jgi:hypothetical protein
VTHRIDALFRWAAVIAAMLVALPGAAAQTSTGLANPASQNCVAKGGTLSIEKNPKGAEFGVCLFADNLQCEEWAMLRGECRTGGIKVTGYVTPSARYCAITGGTYAVVSASNTPDEKGTCTFPSGGRCDAAAYFDGSCTRRVARTTATPALPQSVKAHFACSGGKAIDASFVNGASSRVDLVLSDGRKLSLPQAPSGSGARYANADESVVFWNKGNTAFVEEGGKTTYDACATKR